MKELVAIVFAVAFLGLTTMAHTQLSSGNVFAIGNKAASGLPAFGCSCNCHKNCDGSCTSSYSGCSASDAIACVADCCAGQSSDCDQLLQ